MNGVFCHKLRKNAAVSKSGTIFLGEAKPLNRRFGGLDEFQTTL